jgi:hypothetical protein
MTIIRPVCSREFVALPNVILNDERLTIETRGMLAYILSKPKTWQIRPVPLARALSKKGSSRLGRTKLARMFKEAQEAGYMARSAAQSHRANGDFASYDYVVGMPEDVAAAIETPADAAAVTFSAQSRFAHTHHAHTHHAHTQNEHRSHKVQNPEKQILKSTKHQQSHPLPLPDVAAARQNSADKEYTAMGRSALAHGMVFVFEESEPFIAWRDFRGVSGMPLIDVAVIQGKRRRGVWLPSLYPPSRRVASHRSI